MASGFPIIGVAAMRAAEARAVAAGAPVSVLMERAGAALGEAALRFGGGRPVLILCGPGNNGGDGYVAARWLAMRGTDVRVAATAPAGVEPAMGMARLWAGPVGTLAETDPAPVLVDALYGNGLARPLDAEVAGALARFRAGAHFTIAADLPSGVEGDTGADLGAAGADLTLAFAGLRPAHLLDPAAHLCGDVRVVEIGIPMPPAAPWRTMARPGLRAPAPDAHKYRRGQVAVIGGRMAGAGELAATAALRGGAGIVHLFGDAGSATGSTNGGWPQGLIRAPRSALGPLCADGRLNALLIGPGLGRDAAARRLLDALREVAVPMVLDGDALSLLGPDIVAWCGARQAPTVLTPHEGEFARLFGGGFNQRAGKPETVIAAARQCGAVIVAKGSDTVVADGQGRARFAWPAPGWLAMAGSGDVLAGLVAARLAMRGGPDHADASTDALSVVEAAAEAVWLHGEAGHRAGAGLIADDLLRVLPGLMKAPL